LPSLITGSFGNGKGPILMLDGTQIVVESPEDIPCHADGELVSVPGDGINKLIIRLVSKGLPVVVGPGFSSS
jgi:diacylglycerol kinase family enzyme